MTRDEALAVLHATADVVGRNPHPGMTSGWPLDKVHRRARAAAHPDRHEGDQTLWDQVEQAAAVLGMTS